MALNGDHPQLTLGSVEVGQHCLSLNQDTESCKEKHMYDQEERKLTQIDRLISEGVPEKQETNPYHKSRAEKNNRKEKYAEALEQPSSDDDNQSEKDTADSDDYYSGDEDNDDNTIGAVAKRELNERKKENNEESSKNLWDGSYLKQMPQSGGNIIKKIGYLLAKLNELKAEHDGLMIARNRRQNIPKACNLKFVLYCKKCKCFCCGPDHPMDSNDPMASNVRRDDGTCVTCWGHCALDIDSEHHDVLPHNSGYSSVNISDEVSVLSIDKENYRRQIEQKLGHSFYELKSLFNDPNCSSEWHHLEKFFK